MRPITQIAPFIGTNKSPGEVVVADKIVYREPNLLVRNRRPVGRVRQTDYSDCTYLFQESGIPKDHYGPGPDASSLTSSITHNHEGLSIPSGGNYINLPFSYFNYNGSVTLTFRVKVNTDSISALFTLWPTAGSTDIFAIYAGDGSTAALTNELILIAHKDGVDTTSVGLVTTERTLLYDDKFHNITVTADGSSWRLWLDGIERTLSPSTGGNSGLYYSPGANRADLCGRVNGGTPGLGLDGTIAFFRFDKRILSDGEIEDLHAGIYDRTIPV